jgi:hypothetical protein
MDVTTARGVVTRFIEEVAAVRPAIGDIECVALIDDARDTYAVVMVGWDRTGRVLDPLVLARLANDKVYVEADGTDLDLVGRLLDAGVPADHIVIGYQHPDMRADTEFAVA